MSSQTGQRPPLTGIRVLDFTHVIAGPYCTMMLADMGADVVKVERPGEGDDLRHIGRYPGREKHEDYFYTINRRKRSITLDLTKPEELELCYKLVERADVAVQNYGPKQHDTTISVKDYRDLVTIFCPRRPGSSASG